MALLIRMDRPDLENLPEINLPEGYRLVTAADFDDPADVWARVIKESFGDRDWNGDHVRDTYMSQPQYDPEGVFFIMHGDDPVSTAFAWVDVPGEEVIGRVHWVGSLPEHRGQGLARTVVAAVLRRLRDRGFQRAFLETQPYRLPAISVYLRLGFEPSLRNDGKNEEEQMAWDKVMIELGR